MMLSSYFYFKNFTTKFTEQFFYPIHAKTIGQPLRMVYSVLSTVGTRCIYEKTRENSCSKNLKYLQKFQVIQISFRKIEKQGF